MIRGLEGAASTAAWSAGLPVPAYLALRQGRRPLILVAPHGGRRNRPIRRGDHVNDLHTAEIAWELAERLDAHAIVNHGLDRNDVDLNRITGLAGRAPEVLALLVAAVDAAEADSEAGQVPFVAFVHGWNMVVPCCDIGIGLRRRGGRLTGRYPTLSRRCYDERIAAIEEELTDRGVRAAVGRRYTASGKDNAAQIFSGRFTAHDDAVVAALAGRAAEGRVDAAQLELGIPLRWPGAGREAMIDGLVAALSRSPVDRGSPSSASPKSSPTLATTRNGRDESPPEPPRHRPDWRLPSIAGTTDDNTLEPGIALQAVLNADRGVATFLGVEATGPHTMAARLSLVCTDGTMMLLVGEGEWKGQAGHYDLEGLSVRIQGEDAGRIDVHLQGRMIRYPTHDAYLDLEEGLASSQLVDAEVRLGFEALSPTHGRLRGQVRAADVDLDLEVDTVAFLDRGGRRSGDAGQRIRVVSARDDGSPAIERSPIGPEATLTIEESTGTSASIRAVAPQPEGDGLVEAEVLARVPVWRPLGAGVLLRWTFGIVRCRFADGGTGSMGLFESLEIFERPAARPGLQQEGTGQGRAGAGRGGNPE